MLIILMTRTSRSILRQIWHLRHFKHPSIFFLQNQIFFPIIALIDVCSISIDLVLLLLEIDSGSGIETEDLTIHIWNFSYMIQTLNGFHLLTQEVLTLGGTSFPSCSVEKVFGAFTTTEKYPNHFRNLLLSLQSKPSSKSSTFKQYLNFLGSELF